MSSLTLKELEELEEYESLLSSHLFKACAPREQFRQLISLARRQLEQQDLGKREAPSSTSQTEIPVGTDAPPGMRSPREWLEKYLDTENAWLLDGYHNDRVVHEALRRCANVGKSVPFMYQYLSHALLLAYREQFNLNLRMAKLGNQPVKSDSSSMSCDK